MRQTIHLIIYVAIVTILMAGCTGNGGSKHMPQASDTLYTEKAAMDVYAKEPERALDIIDSALIVGNVKDDKASFLRAKVYSCAYEATRQDKKEAVHIVVAEEQLMKQVHGCGASPASWFAIVLARVVSSLHPDGGTPTVSLAVNLRKKTNTSKKVNESYH